MKFDVRRVIISKEAISLESPPDKMIIIGSGAIGCEFAYYFNEFGTQVHLLEMEDRILPNEDLEISNEVQNSFEKVGIKISIVCSEIF